MSSLIGYAKPRTLRNANVLYSQAAPMWPCDTGVALGTDKKKGI
jgi:hypothetical protein